MVELALALLTGVAIGGALAWLTGSGQRCRLEAEIARRCDAEARLQAFESDRHTLTQEINALAAAALRLQCCTPLPRTTPEPIMDKPRLAPAAEA